jgi:prepilin-type N-terminal cleavage/methylation domain-containing protein
MKRAFTLVEIMAAVLLLGLVTAYATLSFNSVLNTWHHSTNYVDKLQRSDFALNQVISGLRSLYYPHEGKQSSDYGFVLINNGDGSEPDRSDVIEWSKRGTAIIGNKSTVADTVHRIRLMVLEEGNTDFENCTIEKTGLYARCCPDVTLRPKDNPDSVDYTFENDEMYKPILIAPGIVGFNCRVLKDKDDVKRAENDESLFEDEWTSSNTVPYKVELTFMLEDPDGHTYDSDLAPIIRIVRIPLHEQSKDGAQLPSATASQKAGPARGGVRGGNKGGNAGGAGNKGDNSGAGNAGGTGNKGGGAQSPSNGGASKGVKFRR